MVTMTATHLELSFNAFSVVPTTHADDNSDGYYSDDTVSTALMLVNRIIDYLYSHDDNTNLFEGIFSIADIISVSDNLHQLHEDNSNDTALYEGIPSYNIYLLIELIDKIKSSDTLSSQVTSIDSLTVIALFRDVLDSSFFEDLSDGVLSASDLSQIYIQIYNAIDTCLFQDTSIGTKIMSVAVSDTSLSDEQVTNTAELFQLLIDGASWIASLGLDGEDFFTYAFNTQTKSVTNYDNFKFNSMSKGLACSSDGIYILSGNTDNGSDINSSIKTGLMDFGESLQKQVPYAYLGITSDSNVLLKTISTYQGVKKERWYKVATSNTSFETSRVKLAKGVKSRYWQFELVNISGSDFELDSLELIPLILNRRIK